MDEASQLALHGRRYRHPDTGFEGVVVGSSVYLDGRPAEVLLHPGGRRKARWHVLSDLELVQDH